MNFNAHTHRRYPVADLNFRLMDVFTGYPGSVHDARVWRNSELKQLLERNGLPAEFHLLGNSAYPLETYLRTTNTLSVGEL